MASHFWTKNQQQHCKSNHTRAPSSMFSSNNNLSPRQIATKACNLAIKKLDRDDKRSRPQYNVRERLLLCNTLSNAENFLQKRTPRTNRRVMAFEEEDSDLPMEEHRNITTCPSSSASQVPVVATTPSMYIRQEAITNDDQSHRHDHDHPGYHSPLYQVEEMDYGNDSGKDQGMLDNHLYLTASTSPQQHQQDQAQYMTLEMALQQQSYQPSSMGHGAFVIPHDDDDDNNLPATPTYSQLQHQAQFMTLELALQQQQQQQQSKSMSSNAFVIPQDDEDFLQYPSSFLIPNNNNNSSTPSNVFSSDCRLLDQQKTHTSHTIAL